MMASSNQLANVLAAEEDKLLACVHCGLCLEACPTYVQTGDENDSPRGRIYLMRAVEEKRMSVESPTFERHINRCLGCRACESACPAGVEYGQLLEAARADLSNMGARKSWTNRALHFMLRHVWTHPARLRFAFALSRLMRDAGLVNLLLKLKLAHLFSPRMDLALALLQSSSPIRFNDTNTRRETPAMSMRRQRTNEPDELTSESRRVLLFKGCVTEGLFGRVNRATERVLAVNNCRTHAPRGQVCCGALHAHAGELDGARELARRNIESFADAEDAPIITNAGGCGAMLASYAHLLADDAEYEERARAFSARVRDISQQLDLTGIERGARIEVGRVTYDASCHLLYGQRASDAPLKILSAISELEFVPLVGSDVCCGGAGVYNLLEPELSGRVLAEKLAHIKETGAQIIATGNPGCHMQIGAGARLAGFNLHVCHPIELLDAAYNKGATIGER